MYCRKCGKEINNDVVFCPYCGEATTTGSASNKPLGEKKTIEKANVSNGTKKKLIFVGAAIIVVLLAIILILVNGGKNKENDSVDTNSVTDEKVVEDSILCEIIGDLVEEGKYPDDMEFLSEVVKDISCDVLGDSVIIKLITETDMKKAKVDVEAAKTEIFQLKKIGKEFTRIYKKNVEIL